MNLKDCPVCGMERIPEDVRLCTACEVDERWGTRFGAVAKQAEKMIAYLDERAAAGNAEAKKDAKVLRALLAKARGAQA